MRPERCVCAVSQSTAVVAIEGACLRSYISVGMMASDPCGCHVGRCLASWASEMNLPTLALSLSEPIRAKQVREVLTTVVQQYCPRPTIGDYLI